MSSRLLTSVVLLVVGATHLLPLLGVLGTSKLELLYQVRIEEPNLLLLMRHRALLFGLLTALLLAAAFRPVWHGLALLAAWGSVLGFVLLAPPELSPSLHRVWWIDVALLPLMGLASWAHLSNRLATWCVCMPLAEGPSGPAGALTQRVAQISRSRCVLPAQ